jgi:hypothetical protein
MILFLRDKNNENLYEVEINKSKDKRIIDVHGSVNVEEVLWYVVEKTRNGENALIVEFIKDFSFLDEIRGWYWEVYNNNRFFHNEEEVEKEYDDVVREIRKKLKAIAPKYSLSVVED